MGFRKLPEKLKEIALEKMLRDPLVVANLSKEPLSEANAVRVHKAAEEFALARLEMQQEAIETAQLMIKALQDEGIDRFCEVFTESVKNGQINEIVIATLRKHDSAVSRRLCDTQNLQKIKVASILKLHL